MKAWPLVALALLGAACGAEVPAASPALTTTYRFAFPTAGPRHFVVEFAVPADYHHWGWAPIGQVSWSGPTGKSISLRVNSSELTDFDPEPCKLPALQLPAVHGTQLACISSSGYHVVRTIMWGADALRCSVRDSNPHEVQDGWELCARMKVVLDTPSLRPEIHDRFVLSGDYEIEIDVPRLYRPDPVAATDVGLQFWRGTTEPHISIRLASRFEHPSRPCQDFPRQVSAWQVSSSDGGGYCESEDSSMVRRVMIIDDRTVLCDVWTKGFMSAAMAGDLRAVCETMKVSRTKK